MSPGKATGVCPCCRKVCRSHEIRKRLSVSEMICSAHTGHRMDTSGDAAREIPARMPCMPSPPAWRLTSPTEHPGWSAVERGRGGRSRTDRRPAISRAVASSQNALHRTDSPALRPGARSARRIATALQSSVSAYATSPNCLARSNGRRSRAYRSGNWRGGRTLAEAL